MLDYQLVSNFDKDLDELETTFNDIINDFSGLHLSDKSISSTFDKWKLQATKKASQPKNSNSKKEWTKSVVIFMKLLRDAEQDSFVVCNQYEMAEAFAILSHYSASNLANGLSALNNDSMVISPNDLNKVKKLLKSMLENLDKIKVE
jgi:hypothetical protein